MKFICTGGRDFKDKCLILQWLDEFNIEYIAVGDCPTGVDLFVTEYAVNNNIPFKQYKANWQLGRKAGPLRNKEMCQMNTDCYLLAFPGGKGTLNCIKEAKKLGIVVLDLRDIKQPDLIQETEGKESEEKKEE